MYSRMSAICSKLEKCRLKFLFCVTRLNLPSIESLASELNTAITQPQTDVGEGSVNDTVDFQTRLGAKDTKGLRQGRKCWKARLSQLMRRGTQLTTAWSPSWVSS